MAHKVIDAFYREWAISQEKHGTCFVGTCVTDASVPDVHGATLYLTAIAIGRRILLTDI